MLEKTNASLIKLSRTVYPNYESLSFKTIARFGKDKYEVSITNYIPMQNRQIVKVIYTVHIGL